MKPSDLRIGNLVTVNNPEHWPDLKDKHLEVIGITKCEPVKGIGNTDYSIQLLDRKKYRQTYSQFICFIEPIELDESWLSKFSFELTNSIILKRKTWWNIKVSQTWTVQQLSGTTFALRLESDGDSKGKIMGGIKHVHELQNIYYCHVGEELVLQD